MAPRWKALLPLLLCVGCANPATTYEERMATVIPVFEGQLDEAARRLEDLKARIRAAERSDDARFLLDRMTLAIEADLRKARLQLVRAGADADGDALDEIGDAILAIHAETEELRSMVDELRVR